MRIGEVRPTWRYWLLWLPNRIVMRLVFEIRCQGLEHRPEPPYLIVVNHHNGFDPMLLMAATPMTPRIVFFGPMERDFSRGFRNRVMGFFGSTIPYRPDRRGLGDAVRTVHRVFAERGVLAIFAEGRVGFRETELLPFEEGAAAFAMASRVPVVPCAMIGSTHLWFRAPIRVRFGPPIAIDEFHGKADRDALEERMRAAVAELLPDREPSLPRRRPLAWLTDLLNGPHDIARRRKELSKDAAEER
jgi:1-acyl-sn-glycerol-3-phosphate acyltransferase